MIKNALLVLILCFNLKYVLLQKTNSLEFYQEPSDTYVTKNSPAILKCKIENARTGFFKCNDRWSQEPSNSKIIQIGNKQILSIEHAITKSQLDDYKKNLLSADSYLLPEFWCTCQGWLNSADDTIISRKAYVKLAYLQSNFEWEPMPTSGLLGKSVEIRCLPPEGDPKPNIHWLKNGLPLEKSNKRIIVSHEGSLLINDIRITDSANYTCVAENIAGKRLSDSALLTVTENKGWSDWSNWTECTTSSASKCGEGIQKRYRTCLNPPTVNNAIGCDGFPYQSITCYIPCNSNSILENIIPSIEKKVNHLSDVKIASMQNQAKTQEVDEVGYWWTQWSSWSMVCNADCMRPRKRECKHGVLSQGKLAALPDERTDLSAKINKCPGTDIEYGNCTFYCERVTKQNIIETQTNTVKPSQFPKQLILPIGIVAVVLSILILIFICIKCRNRHRHKKQKKSCPIIHNENHPIYYSVQPDYAQDTYMDICTLLPQPAAQGMQYSKAMSMTCKSHMPNGMLSVDLRKDNGLMCSHSLRNGFLKAGMINCNGVCNGSGSDDRCDASRNSTTTTTSGSSSTSSSKIKLTASPTDSLIKSANNNCSRQNGSSCTCCNFNNQSVYHENALQLDYDYENNAYQIMKLINERKTCVCPAKQISKYQKGKSEFDINYNFDLYAFSLYKSGGFIELPKYSMNMLIPDDIFIDDLTVGIFKAHNENILNLKGDQTVLSSILLIKTNYDIQHYSKPILISTDHAAQYADADWDTTVFYKSLDSGRFEEINEQTNLTLYSQVVSNKFFIMTEKDGMYVLVGRPKLSNNVSATKEMKYAIILVNGAVKIYLTQNTRANTEMLNEEIQKSNGKIIKMPELFELSYPKKNKLENSYLNLDFNIVYNNLIINSDSTSRKIRMSDVWNSSCDFIEIEIPVALIHSNNNNNNSNNSKQSLSEYNYLNKVNFDLKVSFEFENKLLFSYSNLNANTSELHTANCNHQEFYSSVSVNPVFIPLKITGLLDDYMLRCFKMNTLKKNNWKLFANLLKCDRNNDYFSNKDNSFELILSLWLMINLSRSENENITIMST